MKSIPFLRILKSEFQKTKNIWGLTLSVVGPIGVSLIVMLGFLNNADQASNATNPWYDFAKVSYQFYAFLYPLFATLITFLIANIEHKNRGFKYIFSLPAPKSHFYISKVIILLFWIACSLLTALVCLYIFGNVVGLLVPAYGFQEYAITPASYSFIFRSFVLLLSIISIHFFLSLYWDNFIVAVGVGVFLVIFGLVIYSNWKYDYLIPYTFSIANYLDYNANKVVWISRETWISLIYAVVFFTGGYFLMARKNIN